MKKFILSLFILIGNVIAASSSLPTLTPLDVARHINIKRMCGTSSTAEEMDLVLMAQHYQLDDQTITALKETQKKADEGCAVSQFELSNAYFELYRASKQFTHKAGASFHLSRYNHYLNLACENNHSEALYIAGLKCSSDDEAKGKALIRRAILNGHAPAQYFLSKLYMYGYIVKKDIAKAYHFKHLAKEGGYAKPKRRTVYLGADFEESIDQFSPLINQYNTSTLKGFTPLSILQVKLITHKNPEGLISNDPEELAEALLNRQYHLIAAQSADKERLKEYSVSGVKKKTKESLRLYKHSKRLGYTGDITRIQTLSQEPFDHAVIGLCPANRYFSSLNIEKLIRWSLETFKRVTFFIPYRWAQYTYKGEHIANGRAIDERSAIKRTNDSANDVYKNLITAIDHLLHSDDLNPADREAIAALKATLPLYIKGKPFTPKEAITEQFEVRLGSELEKEEAYQEVRQHCLEQYDRDPHLREVCRQMVRTLLTKRTSADVTEEAIDMAVEYILHELPLFFGSTKLFGTPSSFNIYHEMADYVPFIPEDSNQGFLCFDVTESQQTNSSGACSSSSSSSSPLPEPVTYSPVDDLPIVTSTPIEHREKLISLLSSVPDHERETVFQLFNTYEPFLKRLSEEYIKNTKNSFLFLCIISNNQPELLGQLIEYFSPHILKYSQEFFIHTRILLSHIISKTPEQRKNALHIRTAFSDELRQFALHDENKTMSSLASLSHNIRTNQTVPSETGLAYYKYDEIMIEAISRLPEHERGPIVSLALPYIIGINHFCILSYLFKAIEAVPAHDRENVLRLSAPLMTRERLDEVFWPELIKTVSSIHPDRREPAINAALNLETTLIERITFLNTTKMIPEHRHDAFLSTISPHLACLQDGFNWVLMAIAHLDPDKITRAVDAIIPLLIENGVGEYDAFTLRQFSIIGYGINNIVFSPLTNPFLKVMLKVTSDDMSLEILDSHEQSRIFYG